MSYDTAKVNALLKKKFGIGSGLGADYASTHEEMRPQIERAETLKETEREALEALVTYRKADKACNAYYDGSPFPGTPPPFTNDELLALAGKVRVAVDKVIAARTEQE